MPADVKQRKFESLATELRDQIRRGALKPGDRLPTLAEINLKSGLTNPTILRAHTLLEREGLITRRRGHGTFVASRDHQRLLAGPLAKTIVVLTPHAGMPIPGHQSPGWAHFTTAGILEEIHRARCHAIMLHPDTMQVSDIEWLAKQRPFGVIIDDNYSSDLEHLRLITEAFTETAVPIVAIGSLPFWTHCDRVESDHEQGTYMLTQWLIAHGCHRIVPIRPADTRLDWASKRLAGYAAAMEEAGKEPLPAIVSLPLPVQADTQKDFDGDSRRCAAVLIESMTGPDPCDALLAVSDGPAFYYAAACRLFGKEPGRDALIAGYDNYWKETSERQWEPSAPAVTIDKNNYEIGKALAGLLLERVSGALPAEAQVRLIPPTLVPTENNAAEEELVREPPEISSASLSAA